jgi:signal transduction histidine kinase
MNKQTPKRSIPVLFRKYMLLVFFLFSVVLSGCWIYIDYLDFQLASAQIEEAFLQQQKSLIKTEVLRTVDYINFQRNRLEVEVRNRIRERVYEAYAIAANLVDVIPAANLADTQNMVREALRPIRFNNDQGYYFGFSTDGTEQLLAVRPESQGADVSNVRDSQGQYITRSMIDIATRQQEGFYKYTWFKPGLAGNTHQKISFVRLFEPFNWVLGTGEYLEDAEEKVKTKVLQWISNARFGGDGYNFVLDSKGKMIAHIDEQLVGLDMTTFIDSNGVEIASSIINAATTGDGFLQYRWQHPRLGTEQPKITYSYYFADWDWIICAAVYSEEIFKLIELRQQEYRDNVRDHVFIIVFLNLIVLVVISFLVCYLSSAIERGLSTFSAFFDQAALTSQKLTPTTFYFDEFKKLACAANRMVDARIQVEERRN